MTTRRNQAFERFLSSSPAVRGRWFPGVLAAALALTMLMLSGAPVAAQPTCDPVAASGSAPAGAVFTIEPRGLLDDEGTNARWTNADFSTTDYYNVHRIVPDGTRIQIQAKTPAELRALDSPPPNPFTVTLTATMTNDDGQTVTCTATLTTRYDNRAQPSFSHTGSIAASVGGLISVWVADVFDDVGPNPMFSNVEFSTTDYCSFCAPGPNTRSDRVWVQLKDAGKLRALATPPPSPFTFTATVTMTNDHGTTATGTITFEASY